MTKSLFENYIKIIEKINFLIRIFTAVIVESN